LIQARKRSLFNAWFSGHARSRLRATFGVTEVYGLARARALCAEAPVLLVANHTAWWDPLVALHVSQHLLGVDGYAMMDARNLRKLPFFGFVGAFGVDLDRPADGAAAIKYTARLLDRPGRAVWIFPQGSERPISEKPLDFKPGSAEIARVAHRARAVPVGLRYEFGAAEKPSLYISIGAPLPPERDVEKGRAAHERAVEAELARIERAVRGEGQDFEAVHRASESWIGAAATRVLARLSGGSSSHELTSPRGSGRSSRS
jgi:1-acyl-sn-glycerol-3-phosphate acyltransferase